VCDGSLLPDVMHDILEGSLQYKVKLMLQVMVNEEKYFSLDCLNVHLKIFELGYMEAKNCPSPIAAKKSLIQTVKLWCVYTFILKQFCLFTASQMNVFSQHITFGNRILYT